MRFELSLAVNSSKRGTVLPLNYQYELSSWIYKVLNEGDPLFASWLHSHGYKAYNRPFKLFTFSNLIIPEYRVKGEVIDIVSKQITLVLSFLPDEAITPFINGLFKDRDIVIGNKICQVAFEISSISALPDLEFQDRMIFKTISPIFLSQKDPTTGRQIHLPPTSRDYSFLLHQNLLEKYESLSNNKPESSITQTQIKVLTTPKSKLITIKSGTTEMSNIKAFNYTFEISGNPALIKVGYYSGFGRLGSQGFGCVLSC